MTARLRHYACGSTTHDLGAMFHGVPRGVREFPSGAFLYDGGAGRRVLFDTGYPTGPWHAGWRGAAYRRLLPPRVGDGEDIVARLSADGIDPETVTHVVLSHLHPDHVGGVRHFPHARFVLTRGLLRTLAAPALRTGVLPGLFPHWFPGEDPLVLDDDLTPVRVGGVELRATDLFGDGAYLVLDLPGHADGHVGALVEGRVLLAGDAAWGADLIDASARLKALPRAIQHDAVGYARTARSLAEVAAGGVRIVCSHDAPGEKELLS